MEKEKRFLLIDIIQEWREELEERDARQPRVILYSLGNLSDKVFLIAVPLAASSGVLVPQISCPSSFSAAYSRKDQPRRPLWMIFFKKNLHNLE